MVFDDLFAHREADSSSAVFVFAVEAFEDGKDLFGVFLGEADAVVSDVDVIPGSLLVAADGDDWGRAGPGILEGVGKEVAKQLRHLERDGVDRGEGLAADPGLLLFDEKIEFGEDLT